MHRTAKSIPALLLFSLTYIITQAQAPVLRISNHYNQQQVVYNNDSTLHTAWQPVIYTDSDYVKSANSWLNRKFFKEHLLQVQEPAFNLFGDIVVDEYIGYNTRPVNIRLNNGNRKDFKVPMMNTRGYELSGNIGDKFYFETALYENQGRFPAYVDSFTRRNGVVPFQNRLKPSTRGDGPGFDFTYSTARLIYTPNQHLQFNLGYGNHTIGDGYRSLFLSDYSMNYPYLKTTVSFGKVQYSFMLSQYVATPFSEIYALGSARKWGQTFYLDWAATKNFSVGLFEGVTWPDETADHKKDIGATMFSPIIFAHDSKSPSGIQNEDITGLNLKYKIANKTHLYGQFLLDKLASKEFEKRYGWQLGIRSGDIGGITGWNVQAELNYVRPFTYASDSSITAYGNYRQPLAHPLGANFKEALLVTDYTFKNFYIRLEAFAARYGADTGTANYGHDIFKSINARTNGDDAAMTQGVYTKLYYGDLRLAYILNPKTNLRIEGGFTYRSEKSKVFSYKDQTFYIGVRTTFRKLIYDF